MLDVHPAHHAASTWRDFFIHIATIVIGLLIAIGLEQTVERIHHSHERSELRETLHRESGQILKDARETAAALNYHQDWLGRRSDQVKAAVWQHQPLAQPPAYAMRVFDYPDDPLWRSAKISGLVERLSSDELNAYSEVELLSNKVDIFYDAWRAAESKRLQLEKIFPHSTDNPDFTKASVEDLRTYLSLLVAEAEATRTLREWRNHNLIGAEETILSGNLRLEDIFAAEKAAAPSSSTQH